MNLYENYINNIKNVISIEKRASQERDNFEKAIGGIGGYKKVFNSVFSSKNFSLKPLGSLEPLASATGTISAQEQTLGEHPDFKYLKETGGSEAHYITSAFIDIKNSTGLFKKYRPAVVMEITNTIQRAAIHTCVIFGGYIQRLQGDGVFVYFGSKSIRKKDSSINALNATSFFTYFVKNDLKKVFENEGIEDIHTRIGIDFGDDEKVLWAVAGIGECSEVTTYSLHTSLASKMQGIANANGIVVGDYVKSISGIGEDYFDWVKDSSGEIKKRYIFQDRDRSFYYKALDFNWYKYLKSLPFVYQNEEGELFLGTKNNLSAHKREKALRRSASLIGTGAAYTNEHGLISDSNSGVQNQFHRFHG